MNGTNPSCNNQLVAAQTSMFGTMVVASHGHHGHPHYLRLRSCTRVVINVNICCPASANTSMHWIHGNHPICQYVMPSIMEAQLYYTRLLNGLQFYVRCVIRIRIIPNISFFIFHYTDCGTLNIIICQ